MQDVSRHHGSTDQELRDMTPFPLVEYYWRLEGYCCFHIQVLSSPRLTTVKQETLTKDRKSLPIDSVVLIGLERPSNNSEFNAPRYLQTYVSCNLFERRQISTKTCNVLLEYSFWRNGSRLIARHTKLAS